MAIATPTTKLFLLLCAAISAATSEALCQASGSGAASAPQGPPPRMPAMEALDTNRDHIFDEAEIANASQSLLGLDRNGDGRLTPEELRPTSSGTDASGGQNASSQNGSQGPPPRMPAMEALDTNRDHIFDEAEIANASQSLLGLDRNGDGRLTPQELRPTDTP